MIETKNSHKTLRFIITGGSSGIGRAIALEMARSKHSFFLTGRNKEKLQSVADTINNMGGEAFFGVGDVGDVDEVETLFSEAFKLLKGVDILVANAGVGYFGLLEEMTVLQFDEQFKTNVRGVFLWLRKVLPIMKQQNSGQIVVTSSNLGLNTAGRASIYAATKHAVQAMVNSLREELKGTLVKAATINPGSVSTPWFDGKKVDHAKMLTAEDVAKVARVIIDQTETSNIDHILILPGVN
ncbi:MAG: SDR family oxidoreductase [Candidatus Heimdallarchaeota archaeon]|nr:MAG: SDR family oxidoreductase [Candidatus Heimdallarchaeota archaeon]